MPEPQRKIFVLDTSVILYDFNALQNFQEHDVAIPITVLEELDSFKKGNSVLNLQAREFIRQLDKLSHHNMLHEWIPLDGPARGKFRVIVTRQPASVRKRGESGMATSSHPAAAVRYGPHPACGESAGRGAPPG